MSGHIGMLTRHLYDGLLLPFGKQLMHTSTSTCLISQDNLWQTVSARKSVSTAFAVVPFTTARRSPAQNARHIAIIWQATWELWAIEPSPTEFSGSFPGVIYFFRHLYRWRMMDQSQELTVGSGSSVKVWPTFLMPRWCRVRVLETRLMLSRVHISLCGKNQRGLTASPHLNDTPTCNHPYATPQVETPSSFHISSKLYKRLT